jgi:uncharacterized protein (TIGR03000 family)
MCKRTFSAIATLWLLALVSHVAAAPPPVLFNNSVPPSFYNFNPGYYGPYYPGHYQYGNVNPGVYNNYAYPRLSGYGASGSVPIQSYGSSSTFGSTPSTYMPPVTNYGYRAPILPPPVTMAPPRDATQVHAEVRLPTSNAELWVEGQKTTSTGTWRRFSSPPLVPGERYVYEFRARWFDNGREVLQSRKVPVQAGEQIIVDFTTPPQRDAESMSPQTPARSPS